MICGKSILSIRNSKCKGPEADTGLRCQTESRSVSLECAEPEGRGTGSEFREWSGSGLCGFWEAGKDTVISGAVGSHWKAFK